MKASMTAKSIQEKNAQVVLDPETKQPMATHDIPINTPMPMLYVDDNGVMHDGVLIAKEQSERKEFWWKLMLSDMLNILDDISGKQTKALRAVLDEFDPHTGIIIMSQKELAVKASCSVNTMNQVLGILIKNKVIAMKTRGVYVINPAFMSQGGERQFDTLMVRFTQAQTQMELTEGDDTLYIPGVQNDND